MGEDWLPFIWKDRDSPNIPTANLISLPKRIFLIGFGFKYYLKENMYVGLEIFTAKYLPIM